MLLLLLSGAAAPRRRPSGPRMDAARVTGPARGLRSQAMPRKRPAIVLYEGLPENLVPENIPDVMAMMDEEALLLLLAVV